MTSAQPEGTTRKRGGWLSKFYSRLGRYRLDVRSLALLRIGLALVILSDLFTRLGDLTAHYSDLGVLPRDVLTEVSRAGYWSIHALNGSPIFQGILFLMAAIAALAMLFGYHSRLATIASWVLLISLHNRNPLLIFAADDVLRAVLFWAMFLPLGAAYSVDRAMNTATRPVPIRILSGATFALMAQQCFIYIFSAVFKTTNSAWWPDGSAVYYSLSFDQYVTPFGHLLLNLGPLLAVLTFATLILEWVGPLLIWSPIRTDLCRILAVVVFISLHAGFGLTLNLGIFPFLSIVTWLAFIPTSIWESISKRVYGPKRKGLKIFYDADCGFCKKVVHLIRMLLVLPHTPLATAQSIPEINDAMEKQNSWVIVDYEQRHHYKFEAIAYVVSLSPVFFWVAPILRWRPIMAVGTRVYEWIATHRKVAGRFTRPFKFKPLHVKSPAWLNAVVLFLLMLTFIWNLRSIVMHSAFVDSSQPAIAVMRRVTNSRTAQRVDWLSQLTRLDQSWSIFAPGPPLDDGWHVVTGTPASLAAVEDAAIDVAAANIATTNTNEINVLQPEKGIDFEKPTLGDRARLYKNMQWRTLYINLNRFVGQKIFPSYGNYLCRRSQQQGRPVENLRVYFVEERTAAPGEPQPIEQKLIWEQSCQPIP